jgi:hypothetical protein
MWVYGYIEYRDFLGMLKFMRFCAYFYVPREPAGGLRPRFLQGDCPEQYTNSYS